MQDQYRDGQRISRRRRKKSEKSNKVLEVLEWARLLFFGFLLAFVLRSFVLEFVRVDGPSMLETLQNNEFVMVTKSDYTFDYPDRGTVIICKYPNRDDLIVKRLIGLPGDTVEIKNQRLYVNDILIEEEYIEHLPTKDFVKTTVPHGMVFVMGDNRAQSHDSRADDVGPLPKSYIVGRVRFVVWPLSDWRRIETYSMEVQ